MPVNNAPDTSQHQHALDAGYKTQIEKKSSFVKIFSLSVIKCNIFTLFIIILIIYSSVRFHVKNLYLLFSTSAGICTGLDGSLDEPGAGIGWSMWSCRTS